VRFVNFVFNAAKSGLHQNPKDEFDMDVHMAVGKDMLRTGWRRALGSEDAHYLGLIESELQSRKNKAGSVDALLFLALIKQESRFDPENVSRVGAAGLTQIMPGTGKKLGMKSIFSPPYYDEAGALLRKERSLMRKAKKLILEINEENKLELAKQAIEMASQSKDYQKRRNVLFERYARELKASGKDERLNPAKSIKYGLDYFSRMIELQKGDMSLALASYNAGPHRVKQYKGIPPYSETVGFRNRVLKYYKEYLDTLGEYRIKKKGKI
jgi:hypothetical protein